MHTSALTNAFLRCLVCREQFDFATGDAALVLRHVAYGFDFVHDHRCLVAAQALIFAEPGYDCAAFARDVERRRVLDVSNAAGWAAVLPSSAEHAVAGQPVHFEPLRYWALVEYQDGSRSTEGVVWDDQWLDEPGGAELPEAVHGQRAPLGYASLAEQADPARLTEWAAHLQARRMQLPAVHAATAYESAA